MEFIRIALIFEDGTEFSIFILRELFVATRHPQYVSSATELGEAKGFTDFLCMY